jgi:hypothetical protein
MKYFEQQLVGPDGCVHRPSWSDKPLYYFCTWETCFKLQQIKRWYWQTVYNKATWDRWVRKTVNRRGKEPECCPLFPYTWIPELRRREVDGQFLVETADSCRWPSDEPVQPLTDSTLKKINLKYETLKEWYMKHRNEPDPLLAKQAKWEAKAQGV